MAVELPGQRVARGARPQAVLVRLNIQAVPVAQAAAALRYLRMVPQAAVVPVVLMARVPPEARVLPITMVQAVAVVVAAGPVAILRLVAVVAALEVTIIWAVAVAPTKRQALTEAAEVAARHIIPACPVLVAALEARVPSGMQAMALAAAPGAAVVHPTALRPAAARGAATAAVVAVVVPTSRRVAPVPEVRGRKALLLLPTRRLLVSRAPILVVANAASFLQQQEPARGLCPMTGIAVTIRSKLSAAAAEALASMEAIPLAT